MRHCLPRLVQTYKVKWSYKSYSIIFKAKLNQTEGRMRDQISTENQSHRSGLSWEYTTLGNLATNTQAFPHFSSLWCPFFRLHFPPHLLPQNYNTQTMLSTFYYGMTTDKYLYRLHSTCINGQDYATKQLWLIFPI